MLLVQHVLRLWAAWLLVVDFAASKLVLKIFIYAPLGGRAIIIRIECIKVSYVLTADNHQHAYGTSSASAPQKQSNEFFQYSDAVNQH